MAREKSNLVRYVRIDSDDVDIDSSMMISEGFGKYNGKTFIFLSKITGNGDGRRLIEVPGYVNGSLQVNLQDGRTEYQIQKIPKGQERKDIAELLSSQFDEKKIKFW